MSILSQLHLSQGLVGENDVPIGLLGIVGCTGLR